MAINIRHRAKQASSKNILHLSRLYRFGCHHDMRMANMMLAMDVRPTLTFAAGVWGTHGLSRADPMRHPLQSQYSIMQKRALGLPHSTAHWILCMLTGNWPIHYYIIREFCRYWNRLMDVARHVRPVGEALKMQRRLLRNRKKCWIAQWLDTLYAVVPDDAESWLQINSFQRIDEELLLSYVRVAYVKCVTNLGDPRAAECLHRRIALTSHMVYRLGFRFGEVPKLMRWVMPPHVRQAWYNFLAANSTLPVHDFALAGTPYPQRLCNKCMQGVVGDEFHVLFECDTTVEIRNEYKYELLWCKRTLGDFLQVNTTRTLPFFVYSCMLAYTNATTVLR